MIAAAVTLFSRAGFNGITTRDIAHSANVSEGNIFRYFPSKRDLFIAAIDSELGKLSVRAEVLAESADVEDSRVALRTLFELITDTVVTQPALVRLLHFSALEFGPDMEPVYRRHLDAIVTSSATNFEKWSTKLRVPQPECACHGLVVCCDRNSLAELPTIYRLCSPFSLRRKRRSLVRGTVVPRTFR